jgi:SAM-dependent methyltransferase
MQKMSYNPSDFWETSHSNVAASEVNCGLGVHYVGGGDSNLEAAALYRLRRFNISRVLQKADLSSNPRIFELGSGGGYWVSYFKRFRPKIYIGSDLSLTAVERLSVRYPDCEFLMMAAQGDAWARVRERGPYDLTLAIDVLYHITDDEIWEQTLAQLCTNAAPFGSLLINDYFYEQPIDQPSKNHVKHRKMQDYLNVLDRYDYRVEAIQPIFWLLNRNISGPWRDHWRPLSPILRFLTASRFGLLSLVLLDELATRLARPMTPKCKMRFLLAKKIGGAQ